MTSCRAGEDLKVERLKKRSKSELASTLDRDYLQGLMSERIIVHIYAFDSNLHGLSMSHQRAFPYLTKRPLPNIPFLLEIAQFHGLW